MKTENNIYQKIIRLNWEIAGNLISTATDEADWYYNYACFYAKNGDIEIALEYLEKALNNEPSLVDRHI